MTIPANSPSDNSKARSRLFRQYRRLKSWRAVAAMLNVNVYYVFNLAKYGIEPTNDDLARRIGIRRRKRQLRTINDHLANDALIDMPGDLLIYALQNREVYS